uniref:AP-1 complex subunit gamma-2-like isoform X1 n=1 Tax=Tanacetum cinerariifolium TaxID=118510 RepID=A0A6L2M0N5_TANCI|nr:AP-1 complex subunit gamma-2-like isoform X1 [Tanacetum cinerariifolium]
MLVNGIGMLDLEDPITVTENDAVDVVEAAIQRHSSDLTTRAMCLIALLKLSSRFPSCSQRIKNIVTQSKGSLLLELQQRSIEFDSILEKHQNIRSTLVERMPALDEATYRRAGSIPVPDLTSKVNLPNGGAKTTAAPLVDLLDLGVDEPAAPSSSGGNFFQDLFDVGTPSSSSQSGTTQAQKSGTDALLDLLSIGSAPPQNGSSLPDILSISQDNKTSVSPLDSLSSTTGPSLPAASTAMMDLLDGFGPSPPPPNNGPAYPPIVAFESSSLRLTFNFSKQPDSPQTTQIEANFANKSSDVYTDFIFQAAVPKFLQLHLEPASSNTLAGNGNGSITQKLRVTNSQHGKKSIVMRIRISYKLNNKDMLEEGQISNFPCGL